MLLNFDARKVMAKLEHQSAQKQSCKGIICDCIYLFISPCKIHSKHVKGTFQYLHMIILMDPKFHSQHAMLIIICSCKKNESAS